MIAFALPRWVERLLGVDPVETGEGARWGYDTSWTLAPWLTVLLGTFCVAYVAFFYFQQRRAAGASGAVVMGLLRLASIGLVCFMIAGCVLTRQRTGLPYVVIVVDDSRSMDRADKYRDEKVSAALRRRLRSVDLDEPTRINLAKALLLENNGQWMREIEKRYKLRFYFAASAARNQPGDIDVWLDQLRHAQALGESSRLGLAVRSVLSDLRGTPPSAIILLSDGVTTEGETLSEAAAYARRKNVPLFTIGLGSEESIRNLELSHLLVDDVVFVNDVVNFEAQLIGVGFAGREVEVTLREKDNPRVLARTTVKIAEDGQPQQVRLPYRPTSVGDFEYIVEAARQQEEEKTQDNVLPPRTVSVRKEQIRVLLAQSVPSLEFRYLKTMLERDSTIELRTVLQDSDPEFAQIDKSALRVFPVRKEELFKYDVVIFGDVDPTFLSNQVMSNLVEFVTDKGRGVIFISGPRYTPLAYRDTPLEPLFPVDLHTAAAPPLGMNIPNSFVVSPTGLGSMSPHMQLGDTPRETARIWSRLPGVYWLLECPDLKPAAQVLAEHPVRTGGDGRKLPVFCLQLVGGGKVMFHAVDETYRWRYRLGDVLFARYWVQTLRFLSRSKLSGEDRSAELTTDRENYKPGEPVRFRVRFRDESMAPAADDGVVIMLERDGHKNQRVTLRRNAINRGVFEGVFSQGGDGKYHGWILAPTLPGRADAVDFTIEAPPGEMEKLEMDAAELKQASALTGGKFYTVLTAARLINDLPEGRQVVIESLEPIVLWNKVPVVLLLLLLVVAEWIMRKRKGLL